MGSRFHRWVSSAAGLTVLAAWRQVAAALRESLTAAGFLTASFRQKTLYEPMGHTVADVLRAKEVYALLVLHAMRDEAFREEVLTSRAGNTIASRASEHDFPAAQRRLTGFWDSDPNGAAQRWNALELDAIQQHRDPSWFAFCLAKCFSHNAPSHLLLYSAVGRAVSDLLTAGIDSVTRRNLPQAVGGALTEAALYTAINAGHPSTRLTIDPAPGVVMAFLDQTIDDETFQASISVNDAARKRLRKLFKRKAVPGMGKRTAPGAEATKRKADWFWQTAVTGTYSLRNVAEEQYGPDAKDERHSDIAASNRETKRLLNLLSPDDYFFPPLQE